LRAMIAFNCGSGIEIELSALNHLILILMDDYSSTF
jgi:hypothetical protein